MSSITIEQLIERLQSKSLLPAEIIEEIHQQVAKNPERATARKITRWLVKNGHLSRYQAQELLSGRVEDQVDELDELDDLEAIDDLEPLDQPGPSPSGAMPPGLDPSLMQAAGLGPAASAGGAFGAPPPRKKGITNVWDNKWLLMGGGLLVALVLGMVFLIFVIDRGTGDEAFALAEEEYEKGRYAQAIPKYDRYLENFPEHPKASVARVRRALCQMRRLVNGARGASWIKALDEIKKLTEEIRTEDAFADARPELATMLHDVAEGLAEHAQASPSDITVKRCQEALNMCNNSRYVPPKHRQKSRLARVTARLGRVEFDLDRGRRKEVAIAGINQAVEEGKVAEAYKIRKSLLKDYPDLANDPDIQEAILEASKAEKETVSFVAEALKAETSEPKSPMKTMVLATPKVTAAPPGVAGNVVFALAEGTAVALDAATGKVLWRRFVGHDTTVPPVATAMVPGSDVLLIDSDRGELVRVGAKAGELKWRLRLPGLRTAPAVLRKQVVVATEYGSKTRLYKIELETGATDGYVELDQPVRAPPVVDRDEQYIYQVGEHSNLYVLSTSNGKCENVIYLGHDAGTITAPPALVGEFLIISENRAAKSAWLRVFKLSDDGGRSATQIQELRVDGHIHTPLAVSGRRLIAPTDRGGVFLYEISPARKAPLVQGPQVAATLTKRQLTYVHVNGARLWAASRGFSSYDVQVTGQLNARWIDDQNDAFLQPLQVIGEVLFHVRRDGSTPGVVVSAVKMDQRGRYWETRLAPPPAAGAVVDPQRREAVVLLADGSLFQVPLDELLSNPGFAVASGKISVDPPPSPDSRTIRLSQGKLVFASEDRSRLLVFDPLGSGPLLRWINLPDAVGGLAVGFSGEVLVPTRSGHVFSFDPFKEQPTADPFYPQVDNTGPYRWLASRQGRSRDVLLSNGRDKLYRVGMRSAPRAHLAALSQGDLEQPLDSAIARLDRAAYAVTAERELQAFHLPNLNTGSKWPLPGRAVWGPGRVGDYVLLLVEVDPFEEVHLKSEVVKIHPLTAVVPTEPRPGEKLTVRPLDAKQQDEPRLIAWSDIVRLKRFDDVIQETGRYRLMCYDDDQQAVFDVPTPHGPLAGAPLATSDGFLLASLDGVVWAVDASGKETGRINLRQPLASGPLPLDTDASQLLLTGRDATLHVITKP